MSFPFRFQTRMTGSRYAFFFEVTNHGPVIPWKSAREVNRHGTHSCRAFAAPSADNSGMSPGDKQPEEHAGRPRAACEGDPLPLQG